MRTGIWLVGGRGSVATTVIAGAAAIRAGLAPPAGCVSELPPFHGLDMPGFDELVFGGHDPVQTSLQKRAEQLAEAGVLPHGLPDLVRADLVSADREIFPRAPAALPEALAADIAGFRARLHLRRVVVVNVSSTEPPVPPDPAHESLAALRLAPDVLPPSSRYAYAALIADCPYVEFTPSPGICLPALDEFAREQGLPYAGRDGKTGETLVKAALAPMFARRALRVRSWSGTNLLGGGDGASLADPGRAGSKASSKGHVLAAALGYQVDGGVHIHNVPDLGEWKTAWDHVTFDGFLGVRMGMQFTWQGCDSALAAPLVLDLARFMALAHAADVRGAVPELGFFFKDPIGAQEHALDRQYAALTEWACRL